MQPTGSALKEQGRVSLRAALTEIEELKQSQRCVEISLAKQIEENEQLKEKLNQQKKANEDQDEAMKKKDKENEELQFTIDALQKKIQGFSKNQGKVSSIIVVANEVSILLLDLREEPIQGIFVHGRDQRARV